MFSSSLPNDKQGSRLINQFLYNDTTRTKSRSAKTQKHLGLSLVGQPNANTHQDLARLGAASVVQHGRRGSALGGVSHDNLKLLALDTFYRRKTTIYGPSRRNPRPAIDPSNLGSGGTFGHLSRFRPKDLRGFDARSALGRVRGKGWLLDKRGRQGGTEAVQAVAGVGGDGDHLRVFDGDELSYLRRQLLDFLSGDVREKEERRQIGDIRGEGTGGGGGGVWSMLGEQHAAS